MDVRGNMKELLLWSEANVETALLFVFMFSLLLSYICGMPSKTGRTTEGDKGNP
jgi:hypothetical protein